MEAKPKPKIQIHHIMKRSSSFHSDAVFDSPRSPLRANCGDPPPDPTPYSSPMASPEPNPKAIVSVAEKYTQCTPVPSPVPQPQTTANRAVREEGSGGVRKVGPEGEMFGRARRGGIARAGELGFRICEIVLCLISFSVMASDRTEGWSGDSFDRYKEYRYCLAVNVIGFVFAGLQAYDLGYYLATRKHVLRCHLRSHFNFFIDQILAYLLISASSSAATRIDDWQSNWGKDEFTIMASASVAISFLAFIAFAISSLISGYNLCNPDSTWS